MSSEVLTLGETMALFRATDVGSLEHVSELRLAVGGAESNVAIGLTRLGHRVTWIGRVGVDSLGRRVLRELRGEGLDVRGIIDSHARTGVMIKENRTSAHTRVTYYREHSAGSRLERGDLAGLDLNGVRLLHVTGITPSLSLSARDAVDCLVDLAIDKGIPVSFDVNHRPALWPLGDAGALYRSLAERAHIVFAGLDEARILTGVENDDADAAGERIRALGPSEVVIKLGDQGAQALVGDDWIRQAAFPISPVDTVGAGDAFVAGYLSQWLGGAATGTCLRTAAQTGAFACLNPGDWEGYPRPTDLDLFADSDPVSR